MIVDSVVSNRIDSDSLYTIDLLLEYFVEISCQSLVEKINDAIVA